jgi:hypothetical protein
MIDPHETIELLRQLVEQLDDWRLSEVVSPTERVEVYAAIGELPGELGVLVRSLRSDAIEAMHDMGVPRGTLLDIASGAAVLGSRSVARYEWRGWSLIDGLADDRVDLGSGEVVRAVDVDVLRAVLPACGSDEQTSSKWNATAVKRYVPVEQYRKGEPVYEDTIDIIPKMARPGDD